jgi:hypothetical protein
MRAVQERIVVGRGTGSVRESGGRLAGLAMSADAKALAGHAGGVRLQMLADRAGLAREVQPCDAA